MTKEEKSTYNRRWYLANRESELKKSVAYAKANRDKIRTINANLAARDREYINKLKNKPCMDCGVKYPSFVMEFDHRDPSTKYAEVGNLASSHWSIKRIDLEIAKCDLVCANCHRIRTHG